MPKYGHDQTKRDAEALYPSVPINDCIAIIVEKLKNAPELPKRTKLSPEEIGDLISLCLSSTDFIFNNRHHTTKDSGPIGLSLMVTVSQMWMIHTMEGAIRKAEEDDSPIPDNIFVYMDDCLCTITSRVYMRPGLRSNSSSTDPAESFNQCLNSVHPRVCFTREAEEDGKIAFLDVLAHRQENGELTTQIYRKPANTNVILKPLSIRSRRHI